jgi:endonuclease/exonuclease/phosphatase family metal-dependent hydrolase
MNRFLLVVVVVGAMAIPAAGQTVVQRREFRILDLNMAGSTRVPVEGDSVIANFIGDWAAKHRANVITLQEVCASQYPAILSRLRQSDPQWAGTYKNFGTMHGCLTGRHGLAVFTRGSHSSLEWWYLTSPLDSEGQRWWGLMKVYYAGLDVFNTHIRSARRKVQIPEVVAVVEQSPLFLLAGDFNTTPYETPITDFYRRWIEVDADREYTYPRRSCYAWDYFCLADRKKIDYIWTNRLPIGRWGDAVNAPSNHRMLRGIFEHFIWTAE